LLEVRELFESANFLSVTDGMLLSWQTIVRHISQHNFVEDLRCIVDESDLVLNYVKESNLPQIDS